MLTRPVEFRGVLRASSNGLLFNSELSGDQLRVRAVNMDGDVLWQHVTSNLGRSTYSADPFCVRDNVAFSTDGRSLWRWAQDGSAQALALPLGDSDVCGAIHPVENGWLLAIHGPMSKHPPPHCRALRISMDGERLWETEIPVPTIGRNGPRTWIAGRRNAILCNGEHALLLFFDMPRTGIGAWTAVTLNSGDVVWQSDSQPWSESALTLNGDFLLGVQGYGRFETRLLSGAMRNKTTWPTHGTMVSDDDGIRLVEMENVLPGRTRFRRLLPTGEVEGEVSLPGYHSSDALACGAGRVVFWRHGQVFLGDASLAVQSIAQVGDRDGYVTGSAYIDGNFVALIGCNHHDGDQHWSTNLWARIPVGLR